MTRDRFATVRMLLFWLAALAILTGCAATALPQATTTLSAGDPTPPWTAAPDPPRVTADSAVLVDFTTGQVLYDKLAKVPRPPASTTKILTALVVSQRTRLTDRVTVSEFASRTQCSCMGLVAGERYTVEQLLWGLLLKSGNDAAAALAEHVGGSIAGFAALMNETARQLGAQHSHFVNPHGLTESGHVSTALDLAIIARAALENPVIAQMVATPQVEVEGLPGRYRPLRLFNTNRLLLGFAGADGVKTGTTKAAGACLISSATREGHRLVAVVLHADGRWDDSTRLLQWGFDHFDLLRLARKGDIILVAPVAGGLEPGVPVAAAADVAVLVPSGKQPAGEFRLQVVDGPLRAPITRGQKVGVLTYVVEQTPPEEQLAATAPELVAAADVPQAGPITYFVRWATPLLQWGARHGMLLP